MDISKYWPFTEVNKIPKEYILIVDTGKIMKRKDATPKNIGKGYTFVGEYPLLASKEVFKRMKKAKDTNDPSLMPQKPKSGIVGLPSEMIGEISKYLPFEDIASLTMTSKELEALTGTPELWTYLIKRDYPDISGTSKNDYITIRRRQENVQKEIDIYEKNNLPSYITFPDELRKVFSDFAIYNINNESLVDITSINEELKGYLEFIVIFRTSEHISLKKRENTKFKIYIWHLPETLNKLYIKLSTFTDILYQKSLLSSIYRKTYIRLWGVLKDKDKLYSYDLENATGIYTLYYYLIRMYESVARTASPSTWTLDSRGYLSGGRKGVQDTLEIMKGYRTPSKLPLVEKQKLSKLLTSINKDPSDITDLDDIDFMENVMYISAIVPIKTVLSILNIIVLKGNK